MLVAASLAALTLRMLLSLAVVLAVIGVGYQVARRRAGGSAVKRSRSRSTPGRQRGNASGLEVVGRVGLTRGASAVAVRFGGKVVLLAAGETGTAGVVAEMSSDEWDEARLVREPIEFPAHRRAGQPATDGPSMERPSFVEALRTATARRA